jgi:GntR family transcriptional regulator
VAEEPKRDTRPLYQQTADRLGELLAVSPPGTFLPSEPALANQFGVSRSTLREALRIFEARGLIVRRRGIGTYVAKPPKVIETGLEILSSIETLAAQIGVELEASSLEVDVHGANEEEAGQLGLPQGAPIIELSRVIIADNRPVAYFVDCLPREYLSPSEVEEGFSGSVLGLLLRRGHPALDRSQAEISAVPADASVADGLGVHAGDVLLYLEALLYAVGGGVVDHSRSYFLPNTFRFHVVRQVQR